jgi:hypothetical protein
MFRTHQTIDPKYNCPFCEVVKKDPIWNPAYSGKFIKDQLRSWQTHLGLCPNRKKAEKIAYDSKALDLEHQKKKHAVVTLQMLNAIDQEKY